MHFDSKRANEDCFGAVDKLQQRLEGEVG